MKRMLFVVTCIAASVLASGAAACQTEKPEPKHEGHGETPAAPAAPAPGSDAEIIRQQGPSYPLTKCVSSGEEFGTSEKPIDYVVNGRLVRLCCAPCKKDVDKDPAAAFKQIDEAVIAAQKPTYPLTTDPVTGAALGKDAIDVVHGTRLVRLASKDSIAAFEKDSKSALAKVDAALIEAQRKTYPLKTCVVTDEALGGEMGDPVDHLYGTRLVRFCCDGCLPTFEAEPARYLAKIDAATKKDSKSGK